MSGGGELLGPKRSYKLKRIRNATHYRPVIPAEVKNYLSLIAVQWGYFRLGPND